MVVFMLTTSLTAFIASGVSARGDNLQRFQDAQNDLQQISSDSNGAADQAKLLQSAYDSIHGTGGGGPIWHGHKGRALTHLQDAIKDQQTDGAQDKLMDDVKKALDEIAICLPLAKQADHPDAGDADTTESTTDKHKSSSSSSSSSDDSGGDNPFGTPNPPGSSSTPPTGGTTTPTKN